MTMSGLSVVAVVFGNFSCIPRSTKSCQSHESSPPLVSFQSSGFYPALIKEMKHFEGFCRLLKAMPMQMVSSTVHRTWLWRNRYCPSSKAFGQQKMCYNDLFFWQSWLAGVSTRPQESRLEGHGRTSYTDWTKNLN